MNRFRKPKKVLFLVGGHPKKGMVPSSRFRVFCYLERMAAEGEIDATISVSWPSISFHEGKLFKRYPRLSKAIVPLGLGMMLAKRLADVARSPLYDAVFIQKPVFPGRPYPLIETAISMLNEKVIFDFDDAIFAQHHAGATNARRGIHRLHDADAIPTILRRAARVLAGNDFLAAYARKHNQQVTVIPTAIDTNHYTPVERASKGDALPVVGWIGTSGNLPYVEDLAPMLAALQERVPFELLIVCNPVNRPLQLEGVRYRFVEWSLDRELEHLRAFDVGIMPLPDREWERGKCGFKILQYLACGIPTVASPVGVNADIIQTGQNGFLVSEPNEWADAIEQLLASASLRRQVAASGRELVVKEYSTDVIYPRLAAAILETAGE